MRTPDEAARAQELAAKDIKIRSAVVHRYLQGHDEVLTTDIKDWLKTYCPDTWGLVCRRMHG